MILYTISTTKQSTITTCVYFIEDTIAARNWKSWPDYQALCYFLQKLTGLMMYDIPKKLYGILYAELKNHTYMYFLCIFAPLLMYTPLTERNVIWCHSSLTNFAPFPFIHFCVLFLFCMNKKYTSILFCCITKIEERELRFRALFTMDIMRRRTKRRIENDTVYRDIGPRYWTIEWINRDPH